MSILQYNGSCCVAMTGKNCVAIASDRRFGVQQTTVATNMQKIFKMHDHLYIGLTGLATDMISVSQKLKFRLNMYKLREEREIKPSSFASLVSSLLYERRFGPWFVEPVIAGLEKIPVSSASASATTTTAAAAAPAPAAAAETTTAAEQFTYKPYIAAMDLIGAPCYASNFVVSGTCSESLYGMCESLWKPDMEQEELFEVISQCLLASIDRDCLSGWGAIVHIITPDQIITRKLKSRVD